LNEAAKTLARGLFNSSSYAARNRSDHDFVYDLYLACYQRQPDQGGWDYWTGQVPYQGRATIVEAFVGASEFAIFSRVLYGVDLFETKRTDLFLGAFYSAALNRGPSSTEQQTQRDAINTASAKGRYEVISTARSFGDSLFNSSEYAARYRSNHDYVYDLYWAYLQYAPDSSGWSYWEGQVASQGRTAVRNAFADTATFQEIAGALYREVLWLTPDQLGTPRIIAERTGALTGIKRHDYLPFGEELGDSQSGRTTLQGYTGDSTRQKFTAKERDIETGLDFLEARYYASTQGRFTSVDPLAASAHAGDPQSWNRYCYSYNNPLRFSDPSGMVPGDYYDQHGDWIGNDTFNDHKNYLVTDQAEVQQIQQGTRHGQAVSIPGDYSSLLELPEQSVRQEAGVAAVARSNSPTGGNTPTDDRRGGFHEEGGGVIQTANGQAAAPALPGPVQDPRSGNPVTLDPLNTSNATAQMVASSATSTNEVTFYHVHPSGTATTRSNGTETTSSFVQPPSQADRNFAARSPTTLGYHIVVGARDHTVYFYNGTGTLGTMPLNRFVNLPPRQPLPPFRRL
jgi:RHS repeat-associated protein